MQTPTCPKCGKAIAPDGINVGRDVAFCRFCNFTTSLSGITRGLIPDPHVDLADPPPGTWYRDNGTEKVVGASDRSIGNAIGMLIVTIIWIGIVSIFVLFVLAASYRNLNKPMPAWMPGLMAQSGRDISKLMNVCMWLFLSPFMLVGVALPFAVLNYLFGRTEVRIFDQRGTVTHGVSVFGRRHRFNTADVRAVRIAETILRGGDRSRDTRAKLISLDLKDAPSIEFGSFLSDERRVFLVSALNVALNLEH